MECVKRLVGSRISGPGPIDVIVGTKFSRTEVLLNAAIRTALGALLVARSAYIETDNYEILDLQAGIETHTTEGTPERAAWLAHLTAVVDAIEDGKDIPAVCD
jgi:hypothetical protein